MFLSPKNKQLLSQIIIENNKIPQHLKNEILVIKSMDEFNRRENMNKPISDLNKSFLLSYINQNINQTKNDFENELKKHQTDFENTIILKKPQNIQFEEIKEEVNLKDVLSKLSVAFENKDVETINSLQKYVPTDYTHWRVADAFSVTNFLEKKRKALKNGLASHLYDNEYQEDAAYFDIQNKLNDNIGLNMYMEKTFKQMEKELDEQIKEYNIVLD